MLNTKKLVFGATSIVGAMLVGSYALFAFSTWRLLSPSESLIISSALLRALPSSTASENWLSAVGLARQAIASPVSNDSLAIAGQRYNVPLPTYSVLSPEGDCIEDSSAARTYITFATPEQLDAYYTTTLPEVGWKYVEQMGAARLFTNNTTQLIITQHFYLGTEISELTLSITR